MEDTDAYILLPPHAECGFSSVVGWKYPFSAGFELASAFIGFV